MNYNVVLADADSGPGWKDHHGACAALFNEFAGRYRADRTCLFGSGVYESRQ